MRFVARASAALALSVVACAQSLGAETLCAIGPPVASDDLAGVWSPCAVARGSLLVESAYYQNASAVGGSALASYPMVDLRTGVFPNVEFTFHSPSQIAESGPRGTGVYPVTHAGYGMRYTLRDTSRFAVAVAGDVLPPMSRFSPNQVQPRYVIGFTSVYAATNHLLLGVAATGTSSGSVGFNRILPAEAVKASYLLRNGTSVSTDLGTRFPARRAPQNFGDAALDQRIGKKFQFKVGAGTAFNAAASSKAHYLASGLDYAW